MILNRAKTLLETLQKNPGSYLGCREFALASHIWDNLALSVPCKVKALADPQLGAVL